VGKARIVEGRRYAVMGAQNLFGRHQILIRLGVKSSIFDRASSENSCRALQFARIFASLFEMPVLGLGATLVANASRGNSALEPTLPSVIGH
jgi:hypothetical protein